MPAFRQSDGHPSVSVVRGEAFDGMQVECQTCCCGQQRASAPSCQRSRGRATGCRTSSAPGPPPSPLPGCRCYPARPFWVNSTRHDMIMLYCSLIANEYEYRMCDQYNPTSHHVIRWCIRSIYAYSYNTAIIAGTQPSATFNILAEGDCFPSLSIQSEATNNCLEPSSPCACECMSTHVTLSLRTPPPTPRHHLSYLSLP